MAENTKPAGEETPDGTEKATFAAGCFWGVEHSFQHVPGVKTVTSGYTGGHVDNPSYRQVCSDRTGHAEAVRVVYDPEEVSYEELLDVFWQIHNPTTPNRQGPDVGSQYRSAVFYHNESQEQAARAKKQELEESGQFNRPVVTEISPASTFWEAEEYHQDYYKKHGKGNCPVGFSL
ncbi:MAG: peptide-methionine (S)-S-oxide reductase MsrA [Phycisphaerae bacterium]